MSAACSVNLRCSSTGRACAAEDRACQSAAVEQGLEILCEEAHDGAVEYVYCPPGASQRDSGIVWLLLAVAFVIAIGGSLVGYLILRRPKK